MTLKRIVCGISGGVDSSVASILLKRKGYEVVGLFMKNWDIADETGNCVADKDREDAMFVCDHLKIPFHEVNFVQEYWNNVFTELLYEYENGATPNPDVLCNKHIKFDAFHKHAINILGADAIATGHYARTSAGYDLENVKQDVKLLQAIDHHKDQTLFLSQISQKALQRSLFPIGDLTKDVVKKIAADHGLKSIAEKKESMGICFIGTRKFHKFIEEYIEPKPGRFISVEDGRVLGTHKGTHYWTLGQRSLLAGSDEAYYIVDVDPKTQDILVAKGGNHPSLFTEILFTSSSHWIHEQPEELKRKETLACQFRYQHSHPLIDCSVTPCGVDSLLVSLSQPTRAVTPGQFAVFYRGDECLGSARILRNGPSLWMLNYTNRVPLRKEFT